MWNGVVIYLYLPFQYGIVVNNERLVVSYVFEEVPAIGVAESPNIWL